MSGRLMIALVLLLGSGDAFSRTIKVEQDGSGDYLVIQDAVDASAPGDTILIGPGRYDQFLLDPDFPGPGEGRAIAKIVTDSLTIKGVDRELVFFGPESATRIVTNGIIAYPPVSWTAVEGITFEYSSVGVRSDTSLKISDCRFNGNDYGIFVDRGYAVGVYGCHFQDQNDSGMVVFSSLVEYDYCNVVDCMFSGDPTGIYIQGHPNFQIRSCSLSVGNAAIKPLYGSAGTIEDCTVTGGWYGVWSDGGIYPVDLELNNNRITGQRFNSIWLAHGHLIGSGNEMGPNDTGPTLSFANASAEFHGNHFQKSSQGTVDTYLYSDPGFSLDLTNNFWYTTESDSISAWIWDGVDDPEIQTIVQYEPFSLVPIPTERKSMGGLKSLFR